MITIKSDKSSTLFRPLLALFLFMSFMLAGCASDTASSVKGEVEVENNEQTPLEEFTPELTVENKIEDNKLSITGETNLPDETVLLFTLLNNDSTKVEKVVTVQSGKFSTNAIPIENLKSGEQSIELSLADDQPDSVIEVIGVDGKLRTGSLIDENGQLYVAAKIDVPAERSPPSDVVGEKVKVTRVVDGDTIKAMIDGKEESVRLILVDTPETKHPQMGVQPYGPAASKFTTERLEGKEVTLEIGVQERDQYGRVLAYVWLGDELFNQTLLENGLARVAVYPPNTKYLDEFNATQDTAKKKAVGIWSVENYVTDKGFDDPRSKAVAQTTKTQTNTVAQKEVAKPAAEKAPDPPAKEEPAACNIKGSKSGIYHTPGSTYYDRTTNVVQWFCSTEEAVQAGYRAPKR